jgi:uncharacterized protein involved in exopolysaccharide biosynthesis
MFDVLIYSQLARSYIEDISYKVNREQELEEIANHVPKQSYLEIQMAKAKEEFDLLRSVNKERRNDEMERLKRD